MMFHKLEVLIFDNKISKREIASKLNMGYNTFLAKLSGKQPFKLDEAFKIQNYYFPELKIEDLFEELLKKSA